MDVRRVMMPAVEKNRKQAAAKAAYESFKDDEGMPDDFFEVIEDIREYDVPYVDKILPFYSG